MSSEEESEVEWEDVERLELGACWLCVCVCVCVFSVSAQNRYLHVINTLNGFALRWFRARGLMQVLSRSPLPHRLL